MERTNEPFLVIVFPTEKAPRQLAELATRFVTELRAACGQPPTMIRPDATALCMLVEGQYRRISDALDRAKAPDTRYLLARVDTPFESAGLSTAHSWLQARLHP